MWGQLLKLGVPNKTLQPVFVVLLVSLVVNWEIYPAGSVVLGWVVRPCHSLRYSTHQGS